MSSCKLEVSVAGQPDLTALSKEFVLKQLSCLFVSEAVCIVMMCCAVLCCAVLCRAVPMPCRAMWHLEHQQTKHSWRDAQALLLMQHMHEDGFPCRL